MIRHYFCARAPPHGASRPVAPLPRRVEVRASAALLVATPRRPQASVPADPGAAGRAIHLPPITRTTDPHAPPAAPAIELSNPIAHRPRALHSGAGQHRSEQA